MKQKEDEIIKQNKPSQIKKSIEKVLKMFSKDANDDRLQFAMNNYNERIYKGEQSDHSPVYSDDSDLNGQN